MQRYSSRTRGCRKVRSRQWAQYKKAFPQRTVAIARPIRSVGFGNSCTTVLRTSFFYNATAVAATGVWTGYLKPGSAYDPTGDLATIQPKDFDQLAALYNRYKVNSATIRIKITGLKGGVGNGGVWVAAAYPAVDITAATTYQGAASQQYAKTTSSTFYINQAAQGVLTAAGAEGKYLSFKLNHAAVVGSKSDPWEMGALVNADPPAGQFMCLPMFLQSSAAGGNEPAAWVLEIDIYQNVTFSQKKNAVDA